MKINIVLLELGKLFLVRDMEAFRFYLDAIDEDMKHEVEISDSQKPQIEFLPNKNGVKNTF